MTRWWVLFDDFGGPSRWPIIASMADCMAQAEWTDDVACTAWPMEALL